MGAAVKQLSAGLSHFGDRVYSIDSNFWRREFVSGDLDDPENLVLPESSYQWTKIVPNASSQKLVIAFRRSIPCRVDDADMKFLSLVNKLNPIVGAYGLGRYAALEEIEGGASILREHGATSQRRCFL